MVSSFGTVLVFMKKIGYTLLIGFKCSTNVLLKYIIASGQVKQLKKWSTSTRSCAYLQEKAETKVLVVVLAMHNGIEHLVKSTIKNCFIKHYLWWEVLPPFALFMSSCRAVNATDTPPPPPPPPLWLTTISFPSSVCAPISLRLGHEDGNWARFIVATLPLTIPWFIDH